MTPIRTLPELIERLEAVKADIDGEDLEWAVDHIGDILDDCRDYADLEDMRRRERLAG